MTIVHRAAFSLILICLMVPPIEAARQTQLARGVVYHDANGNGARDANESTVAGVCVSNGLEVVKTDKTGSYQLPVDNDTIVFVIKPRDWMTAIDEQNIPRFYYIHKPTGSPDMVSIPSVFEFQFQFFFGILVI